MKTKKTSFELEEITPKELERKARARGLIRRTGVPSDVILGSMSQFVVFAAADDTVVMKRYKTVETLPPEGVEVLIVYTKTPKPIYMLAALDTIFKGQWIGNKKRIIPPCYWYGLEFMLEGASDE